MGRGLRIESRPGAGTATNSRRAIGPTAHAFPQPGLQRSGGPGKGATTTNPLANSQPTTGPTAQPFAPPGAERPDRWPSMCFWVNANPGPSLRSSPGYGNGWPVGPQSRQEDRGWRIGKHPRASGGCQPTENRDWGTECRSKTTKTSRPTSAHPRRIHAVQSGQRPDLLAHLLQVVIVGRMLSWQR
jgi:hypothetical protein